MFVLATAVSATAPSFSVDLHGDDVDCYADGYEFAGGLTGWGVPAMAGGYYGGQDYETFCLLIEPGDCTMGASTASVDVTATHTTNIVTIRYLDGISGADSFDAYVDGEFIGTVEAVDTGSEDWKEETFALPRTYEIGETLTIELEALGPVWDGCANWGQVAIDHIDFCFDPEIPEFSTTAALVAMVGGLAGLVLLRRKH